MKRFTALILAMLLVLSMAACGNQESTGSTSGTEQNNPSSTKPSQSKPNETEPTILPTRPGDGEHIHKYASEVTKEPLCEEPGEITFTCECGDTYTAETTVTGHSYHAQTTKEPTCTEPGEATYTCRCGKSYVEALELADHNWSEWIVSKQPTMQAIGEAQRSCSVCGETETKELPVLTVEEELTTYVELIIGLPTFESANDLYAGALFQWIATRVPTLSSEWNEETYQITRVYSMDSINAFTAYYLNKTFDFASLAAQNENLTYDETNNQLIWVTYGAGGGLYATMDSIEKLEADTYAVHYSALFYDEETPSYHGTLYVKMFNGRFIIVSHTNDR